MAGETALYRDEVEQVRRRFAEWKNTDAVRSRLPEELWTAAAELARRDGIDATARALDVDKPSLRSGLIGLVQPRNQLGESPSPSRERVICQHSWSRLPPAPAQ